MTPDIMYSRNASRRPRSATPAASTNAAAPRHCVPRFLNATGRPIAPLVLSPDERDYLKRQVRRYRVARSLSDRCRVILRCADGVPSKSVATELGVHEHTVGKWRRRFLKDRIEGLLDEARPGRPRTIDDDQVAAVIEPSLHA